MTTIFLSNRDEMVKYYREPSIDGFCQISFYLTLPFQRRRFLEIDQLETIIANGGHCCHRMGKTLAILTEDLP